MKLTNSFIKAYGLKVYDGDNIIKIDNINLTDFNNKIHQIYSGITFKSDIIWIKFAYNEDWNRAGIVACGNDINFNIPSMKEEYDDVVFRKNVKKKGWKYNTSGILVHFVNLKWNDIFFLYFLC